MSTEREPDFSLSSFSDGAIQLATSIWEPHMHHLYSAHSKELLSHTAQIVTASLREVGIPPKNIELIAQTAFREAIFLSRCKDIN